ncbi:MAG: glutaredoxin family protein, partial [Coleofasciculus sp. C2-GNP5-27]
IGYKNQIIAAIETAVGSPLNLPTTDQQQQTQTSPPWQVFLIPFWYLCSYPFLQKALEKRQAKRYWIGGLLATMIVSLFVFLALTPDAVIKTFAQGLPFPLFVSTIALADGFNPCAFTVLVILLSLLTYTRSRKDMTLVGTTFIITSAVMYFIFIMLMVLAGKVFLEKYGTLFMLILGILITGAGLINIKDYFWFKKSISLSLSEKQQSTINKRAGTIVRNLRNAQGDRKMFLAALAGTVLLAIFVNVVELGCTAILPAVYMTTLLQYCSDEIGLCHLSWTGLYAAIYIIPLLAILGNFIYSFKSTRLTENQGRVLKLVGGLFMLFFGLAMIFKPQLLTLG